MTSYTAARRIATGGMVEVLLGCQQAGNEFERLVVIKRVLPQFENDARLIHTFLGEARLAASLAHPNIVAIHHLTRDKEGHSLIMEYLSGEDLRSILFAAAREGRRIPVPITCRIATSMANALMCAHSGATTLEGGRAILHLGLSPANVIVTYEGITKVVDFALSTTRRHARPEAVKEKLQYVSPEQVSGQELDGRSDLFSLGAVLHEMLTSRRVFNGPSESAIARNVKERQIPPPSVYNPEVPPDLDKLVARLLERDLAKRTPSADQLRVELEELNGTWENNAAEAVAEWLGSTMADRRAARLAVERQVIEEAQAHALPPEDRLPPMLEATPDARTSQRMLYQSANVAPAAGTAAAAPRSPTSQAFDPPPLRSRRLSSDVVAITAAALALIALVFAFLQYRGSDSVAGEVYDIDAPVAAEAAAASEVVSPAPPAPVSAGLHVHAVPDGARVSVDGTWQKSLIGPDGFLVPVRANKEITVVVAKEGYEEFEAVLRAPPSGVMPMYVTLMRKADSDEQEAKRIRKKRKSPRVRARRSRNERRIAALLELEYEPANASLVINGTRQPGSSPHRLELAEGRHDLQVSAPGYVPTSRTVDLEAGETKSLELNLEREPPALGHVIIRSTPTGAAIRVDRHLIGETPLTGLKLQAGKPVTIELSLAGYETWRTHIMPTADEPLMIAKELKRLPEPGASRRRPITVSASEVTKVSGAVPSVRLRGIQVDGEQPGATKPIAAQLCMDEGGAVTSAKILTSVPAKLAPSLRRILMTWKYEPYRREGEARAACFEINFRLTIETGR